MKKLFFLAMLIPTMVFSQITIRNAGNDINIIKNSSITQGFNKSGLEYSYSNVTVHLKSQGKVYSYRYADIDVPVTANIAALMDTLSSWIGANIITNIPISLSGNVEVEIQDQYTPILIIKFNQVTNSDTLTATTVVGQRYIVVDDTTGSANSDMIIIFSDITDRVYFGAATSFNIDTIFLDTPLDSDFPVGADVDFALTNMAVDGSSTLQIFGIRGSSLGDPIAIEFDITRIIFKCTTDSPVSLDKFGDLTKLTNGLVLRKRDGTYQNLFNMKDNGELAGIMFDWTPYLATNPQQGIDGFVSRLTFAGQSKIGVTVRLGAGEDLEFIIQDNLSGIILLEVIAEGHIVID